MTSPTSRQITAPRIAWHPGVSLSHHIKLHRVTPRRTTLHCIALSRIASSNAKNGNMHGPEQYR